MIVSRNCLAGVSGLPYNKKGNSSPSPQGRRAFPRPRGHTRPSNYRKDRFAMFGFHPDKLVKEGKWDKLESEVVKLDA